ncbi:hypothetical protein HZS_2335 [Henneguya salminicola]|nr:hypothetical protein HZS_2335 [Henneguya salminicola]
MAIKEIYHKLQSKSYKNHTNLHEIIQNCSLNNQIFEVYFENIFNKILKRYTAIILSSDNVLNAMSLDDLIQGFLLESDLVSYYKKTQKVEVITFFNFSSISHTTLPYYLSSVIE